MQQALWNKGPDSQIEPWLSAWTSPPPQSSQLIELVGKATMPTGSPRGPFHSHNSPPPCLPDVQTHRHMHTYVRRDMCLGTPGGCPQSHICTWKHICTHRSTGSSPTASKASLLTHFLTLRLSHPLDPSTNPLLGYLPGLEHLEKLSLQFLLKIFQSFLRRCFVSLKTFLIFSSNWRGVSEKVWTQC